MNQENRQKVDELGQLSNDLQNLLVATDIATLFLDRELRIQRFTPRIEQLFNIRHGDRGRPLTDFTSRIGYSDIASDTRRVLERLTPVEHETQDDAGRWYLTRVLPYRNQEDRIAGVVITAVDITRQKLAERNVREAKGTSERILDTLPEPLLVLNPDFVVTFANGSFYRNFQVTPKETLGEKLWDIANGQWNIAELFDLLNQTPAAVGRFEDLQISRHFDRRGWRVLVLKARRLDGEGIILIEINDITERFEAEREARESTGVLSEQLSARDEYLAMLGHELRNPLGAIRSATALLTHQQPDNPKLRRVYEVLERQAIHMSRIIDGLLDVSRIARGKITVQLQPLDLRDVVRETVSVRGPHLQKRGLALELTTPNDPVWVNGDEPRLAQAIDNLLGNAIKFTEPTGTISVTTERRDSSAVVRVRDTGVGIRAEVIPYIFEPFQQEVQDSARAAGGLGLGLALAKGIVELHGGRIEAHSDGPLTGATFELFLPIREAPSETEGSGGSNPESSKDGSPSQRVLVVEDNEDAAEMMKSLLELAGHDVQVARTAPLALDLLRQSGADVVLCDIGLPGMSGLDFAAAVRRDESLRNTPMVAVSGYGQPDDRRRTQACGFDDHLVKPVDIRLLRTTIERVKRERA